MRVRTLSLEELLARLAGHECSMAAGRRGGPARQHSLAETIEWSFNLCSPAEQLLWARACVFAGGFDLTAAEEVCTGDALAAADVVDLVAGLIDKSVLIRDQHRERSRYRMLHTLRRYGLDRLRAIGEEAAVRRRHRDYYVRLAERGERDWFGPRQPDILADTHTEHANLRAALEFSLATPREHRTGVHLAATLWFYWAGCGMLSEGRHWLDRALRCTAEPGPERGKALWVNGHVATLQGDNAPAVAMLQECREYARRAGDDVALAYATHRLGGNRLVGGDLDTARTLFEEAHQRYDQLGKVNSRVMLAHIEHAITCIFLNDLARAAEQCAIARAIGEQHGEQWAYAYAIYVQALIALQHGDLPQATAHAQSSLHIKRTFQDRLGMVLAIEALAWIAAADGTPEWAAVLLGAAHRSWPSVGYTMFGSPHFSALRHACETAARHAIGEHAFADAFTRGTAFTLDEAVVYALGEKPTHTARPATRTPPLLTRREQQVADLVTAGKSNKEVGAVLMISPRTAESHIDRILHKLGFTSRTQIAAWTAQQQQHCGHDPDPPPDRERGPRTLPTASADAR